MRNFIHINLCISLGIVQLIFVAGIDRSAGSGVGPPPLLLPGLLHVDVDGGCGLVCCSCHSIREE